MHLNHFGQETPTLLVLLAARACVHLAEHEFSEGLCACVGLRVCGQMLVWWASSIPAGRDLCTAAPDRPVKMQGGRGGAAWIWKSRPRWWLTGGEVKSVCVLIEIHEIIKEQKTNKHYSSAKWLGSKWTNGDESNWEALCMNWWTDWRGMMEYGNSILKPNRIFVIARFSFNRYKKGKKCFNPEILWTDSFGQMLCRLINGNSIILIFYLQCVCHP